MLVGQTQLGQHVPNYAISVSPYCTSFMCQPWTSLHQSRIHIVLYRYAFFVYVGLIRPIPSDGRLDYSEENYSNEW